YLEEADQLAGRIAIIDHGRIVREGKPSELKASVGAPTLKVEVEDGREAAAREVLARFGTERVARRGVLAIGLEGGHGLITDIVRALDSAGVTVARIELDAPTLDDVFADATGYRLEGAGEAAGNA